MAWTPCLAGPQAKAHHYGAMKLQLHRSLTFWSGLLVMAFICWAWADSARYTSGIGYTAENLRVNLINSGNGGSAVCLLFGRGVKGAEPWDSARLPVWEEGSIFAMPQILKSDDGLPSTQIFIPHWLLLLAVAVPWAALLLWRAWRRKRAIAL